MVSLDRRARQANFMAIFGRRAAPPQLGRFYPSTSGRHDLFARTPLQPDKRASALLSRGRGLRLGRGRFGPTFRDESHAGFLQNGFRCAVGRRHQDGALAFGAGNLAAGQFILAFQTLSTLGTIEFDLAHQISRSDEGRIPGNAVIVQRYLVLRKGLGDNGPVDRGLNDAAGRENGNVITRHRHASVAQRPGGSDV